MKNRVFGLRFFEDMHYTPYRGIAALRKNRVGNRLIDGTSTDIILYLSTLRVSSKHFALIDRKQNEKQKFGFFKLFAIFVVLAKI